MRFGTLVLVVATCAVVGCGTAQDVADPTASSPAPAPTVDPTQEQAAFCGDLYAYTAAAGATFDLSTFGLFIDGESTEEREGIAAAVGSITRSGTRLISNARLPPDVAVEVGTVVTASSAATEALANGTPALEAVTPLRTGEAKAARDASAAYPELC